MNELDLATEDMAREVVDSCYRVHTQLGPGLLESAYEECLAYELRKRGVQVARQVVQPIEYDGVTIDAGYRMDLLVGGVIVMELKSVEKLLPVHEAQLITYLKLSKKNLGFLVNFNVALIKNGIRRRVYTQPDF